MHGMKTLLMLCISLSAVVDAVAEGRSLEERFSDPPESSRLQTWFHWNGDCVTKEGLAADLKAMGEMDIGTAHVFLPAMAHLPVTAKPLTSEWFDLWETAIREAKRNNVKLGFHNCPGWSSSGGPWIRPEDSMKMVVVSETDYDPASSMTQVRLSQPTTLHDFYRDVAVMAFPIPRPPRLVKASGDFPGDFAGFCAGTAALRLPLGKADARCELVLEYDRPTSPGTAVFTLDDTQFYAKGTISASSDGLSWTKCADWQYTLFNAQKTPKTLRLAKVPKDAKFFRIRFHYIPCPPWVGVRDKLLTSFAFTELPRVEDVDAKNSASTSFGYVAPRDASLEGIPKDALVDLTPALRGNGLLDVSSLSRIQSQITRFPKSGSQTIEQSGDDSLWRILRIGYTTTGKNCAPATLRGLECDKLSKRGLDAHWPNMPKRLLEVPGARDVVSISIIDSYEVGGQNWTEALPEEFRTRRGYDLRPWLPAIAGYVVGTSGETAKFLYDYQRTVGDLFAENYYDYFAELCRRAGIEAACEPYGGPFDSLRCGAKADVPTGEFWLGREPHGSPRVAASIGHLNGRSKIAAEAFTTEAKEGRWQITPAELRRCGDQGWLDGISQLVYHSYLHQPFAEVMPGISLGRHGTQLNRHTTWWPEGIHWSRYVRRGQFLLQSGRPRAEVLVLAGESSPNHHRYATELVRAGGNFDYCGVADLMRLSVEAGGVAVPGGLPYDVLYLGADRYLTVATLRKIKSLVDAGARVAGVRPLGSPSLMDDGAEWSRLVDAVWHEGRVKSASNALEALKAWGRRVNADSRGALRAIRREIEGRDVYFVVNPGDEPFEGDVSLVAQGRPEYWDARDGSVRELPRVKGAVESGRTRVRLELPPRGSCFVVFDPLKASSRFVEEKSVVYADVVVLSARYCARDDKTMGRDVTGKVRRLLADGHRNFKVENPLLGGDPAPNHYKVLDLIYTVDGERRQQVVQERAQVSFAFPRKTLVPAETALMDLSTDWTVVSFVGRNAPAAPLKMARLQSWSESSDVKLKYFSGRAVYEKVVRAEDLRSCTGTSQLVLDLGTVKDVVNVWMNDRFLGCLWEAPYRLPLPADCRLSGNLKIRLEVVNTWPNRLIGDAVARKNGAAEPMSTRGPWPQWVLDGKPDSGTGIYTWSNFNGWSATEDLLPAGVLGPVRLLKGN